MRTLKRKKQKKKRVLALVLHSLAGDPEAEPEGRETQLLFPAPKPSALANEKRNRPIRFHSGQQHGYPDSGTPNTSSAVDGAQEKHGIPAGAASWIAIVRFSVFSLYKKQIKQRVITSHIKLVIELIEFLIRFTGFVAEEILLKQYFRRAQ